MMGVRPSNALLRRSSLFQGLSDRALETIGELVEEVAFAATEPVVRQGEDGDAFYVITDGEATVEQDGVTIRSLGTGDFLGEVSLIDGLPRTATVVATKPTRALRLTRSDFQTLIDEHPSIRLELLMALTERLRRVAPSATD